MSFTYKGKFVPDNPGKYKGDVDNIHFRSSWEYRVMKWCDQNPAVKFYSSEEIVIPYRSKTDGEMHRYFVDFYIEFTNGKRMLIEIKPAHETRPPKPPGKKSKKSEIKYLQEVETWGKNQSKWLTAIDYANQRGMQFAVWTEKTLTEKLGMQLAPVRHNK